MGNISRQPLPTSVASDHNDHRLRRIEESALVLEPRYDARAIFGGGLIFASLGGAAYAVCWLLGAPAALAWWLAVIGLAGGLAWVVVLPLLSPLWTRAVFDREQDVITLRGWRFPNRPTFRLQDVAAVQVCGPVVHFDWESYQLNLVLTPGTTRHERFTLLDNSDRAALRRMGAELAAFLHVPFVDDAGPGQCEKGRS